MPTEDSMTFPAANPATAKARNNARPVAVVGRGQRGGIERHQPVAQRLHPRHETVGLPPGPRQASRSRRVVMFDAARDTPSRAPARPRSARRRRRIATRRASVKELVPSGIAGDIARRDPGARRHPAGAAALPGRAPAGVIAAEPQPLDRFERGGAARAAEPPPGRRRQAAMNARRGRGPLLDG